MAIAKAYIADVVEAADQAAFLGRLAIFYGMGMLFGPALAIGIMVLARAAGSTKETEWASVFFVGAGLGVCAFVVAIFRLKESKSNLQPFACTLVHDKSSQDESKSSRSDNGDDNNDVIHQTEVRQTNKLVLALLFASVFAVDWPIVTVQTMYPLLIQYFWGWGSIQLGIVLSAVVVPTLLAQGILIPVLARKYGERRMTAVAMAIMGMFGTYALFSGTGYEPLARNHHSVSSWVGQKECVMLQNGGEWITGKHAFDVVVRELGADGYSNSSLTVGLCAQLCLGYSANTQLIQPKWKFKESERRKGPKQLSHNSQRQLQPNGPPAMKFSDTQQLQPIGEPLTAEDMLVVGYWNTVSASRVNSRTVEKTPVNCTHFAFAAATHDRHAYCAWLHPKLVGSVAPSVGPASPPLCERAQQLSALANHTQVSGDIYSVGGHHPTWMVLHFVCITLHVIAWALARVGLDALISLNSAPGLVGFTQGLGSSATAAAQTLSCLLSALLLDYSARLFGNFSFPFLLGSALALVCCWMPLVRGRSIK